MKQIIEDKEIALEEESRESIRKAKQEAMKQALEDFRNSTAYPYIMQFFKEQEDYLTEQMESIQGKEMREVFMLPPKEQRAKLAEMSKRDSVLTAVLGALKTIKGKL